MCVSSVNKLIVALASQVLVRIVVVPGFLILSLSLWSEPTRYDLCRGLWRARSVSAFSIYLLAGYLQW